MQNFSCKTEWDTFYIDFEVQTIKENNIYKVLLQSDVHFDSVDCQRDRYFTDLDQAKAINAPVLGNGDFFCAMQARRDKRGGKESLRKEYLVPNYFDVIPEEAADLHIKYKDIFVYQGYGNHETAVTKHGEIDLMKNFKNYYNYKYGGNLTLGGYGGWIAFRFKFYEKNSNKKVVTIPMYHFHGSGGGGVVTNDVITAQRIDSFIGNAKIVWLGHTHDSWELRKQKVIWDRGRERLIDTVTVKTSTYKQEFAKDRLNFHSSNNRPPKPIGGRWLNFKLEWNKSNKNIDISYYSTPS